MTTETTRTVPIDADQARVLREEFAGMETLDKTLSSLLIEISAKRARKELELWESVARLAGYEDGQAPEGVQLKVDHLARQVVITERNDAYPQY
jgi:hypothetical protein